MTSDIFVHSLALGLPAESWLAILILIPILLATAVWVSARDKRQTARLMAEVERIAVRPRLEVRGCQICSHPNLQLGQPPCQIVILTLENTGHGPARGPHAFFGNLQGGRLVQIGNVQPTSGANTATIPPKTQATLEAAIVAEQNIRGELVLTYLSACGEPVQTLGHLSLADGTAQWCPQIAGRACGDGPIEWPNLP